MSSDQDKHIDGAIVPAGAEHNVINASSAEPLKLYTIYSPPEHRDGVVRVTKEKAESEEEHFDGATSDGRSPARR